MESRVIPAECLQFEPVGISDKSKYHQALHPHIYIYIYYVFNDITP